MNPKQFLSTPNICLTGIALSLALIAPLSATGALSQQFYQDAAGLGDAQAASAASANDASTEFYNPAGLIRIQQQQVVFGNNMNMPSDEFSGSTTVVNSRSDTTTTLTGDVDGGDYYNTPFLHYAAPISSSWAFGFGVSAPFQTNTSYAPNSSVSAYATDTKYSAYDISTDLAYAVTDKFSVGAGYDFIRMILSDFNYDVPTSTAVYRTDISGTQWTNSYHLGLLYQFTPQTRVGLAYHAKIDFTTTGDISIDDIATGISTYSASGYTVHGVFPAYTTLSVYHELTPKWTLEGSVNYTEWDQVEDIVYNGETTEPFDYENTWRFAAGAHYVINPKLMLRFGGAYETSPYTNNDVEFGAPVGASYDASVGLHVGATKALGFDVGWTHVFYEDMSVDGASLKSGSTSSGDFSGSSDILGAQLVWNLS